MPTVSEEEEQKSAIECKYAFTEEKTYFIPNGVRSNLGSFLFTEKCVKSFGC